MRHPLCGICFLFIHIVCLCLISQTLSQLRSTLQFNWLTAFYAVKTAREAFEEN